MGYFVDERTTLEMVMSDDLILPSDQIRVKTVLVVEDDEDIGAMIVVALSQETPYQAVLATDGLQALEMIRSFAPRPSLSVRLRSPEYGWHRAL
jgi:PleD family two-component response regulator